MIVKKGSDVCAEDWQRDVLTAPSERANCLIQPEARAVMYGVMRAMAPVSPYYLLWVGRFESSP